MRDQAHKAYVHGAYIVHFMDQRTTLQVPRPILGQLRRFGMRGQTYAEILQNMMREIRYDEFMDRVYAAERERTHFVALDKLS